MPKAMALFALAMLIACCHTARVQRTTTTSLSQAAHAEVSAGEDQVDPTLDTDANVSLSVNATARKTVNIKLAHKIIPAMSSSEDIAPSAKVPAPSKEPKAALPPAPMAVPPAPVALPPAPVADVVTAATADDDGPEPEDVDMTPDAKLAIDAKIENGVVDQVAVKSLKEEAEEDQAKTDAKLDALAKEEESSKADKDEDSPVDEEAKSAPPAAAKAAPHAATQASSSATTSDVSDEGSEDIDVSADSSADDDASAVAQDEEEASSGTNVANEQKELDDEEVALKDEPSSDDEAV